MSVTIVTMAGLHTPAYNNQYLVASSTNVAQTNFKYIVNIQINGGTYVDDVQLKLPKRPDNSYLYYDPSRIVRSQIKSVFELSTNDFFYPSINVPSEFKKVTIGIDEEYGSPVSGFAGASSTYYIWNGSYASQDFADFTYATTSKVKDLTLSPSLTDTIKFEQKYLMKSWHRGFGTANIRYMNVKSYDSSGNLIQSAILLNQFYDAAGGYFRNYISLNCSPYALNNISGAALVSTTVATDVIPSNTAYYTFQFSDTNFGTTTSNLNTVNIDTYCSKYTRYVLHFLNSLGCWDSYTFNKLSRQNTDKETDQYKQIPYKLNSSNKYAYTKDTDDTIVYNTVLTNKWTLNSGYINDAKASWLKDLITSPQIRLESISGDIIAVKCTLKNYETKKKVNDKLFNITIELENALQDVRQGA